MSCKSCMPRTRCSLRMQWFPGVSHYSTIRNLRSAFIHQRSVSEHWPGPPLLQSLRVSLLFPYLGSCSCQPFRRSIHLPLHFPPCVLALMKLPPSHYLSRLLSPSFAHSWSWCSPTPTPRPSLCPIPTLTAGSPRSPSSQGPLLLFHQPPNPVSDGPPPTVMRVRDLRIFRTYLPVSSMLLAHGD